MRRAFRLGIVVMIGIIGILWAYRPQHDGVLVRGTWVLLDPPLPYATFTPTPTPTAQETAQEHIYAVMIENAPAPFTEGTLARIATKTWIWDMGEVVPYELIAERSPTISEAVWQGFLDANRETRALPIFDMVVDRPVAWESIETLNIYFGDPRRGWEDYLERNRFRGGDPHADLDTVGLLMLSTIYFDQATNQAVAILRIGCGDNCSKGVLFSFEQNENGWIDPQQTVLWDTLPPEETVFPPSLLPTSTPTANVIPIASTTPILVVLDTIVDQSRWDHEKNVLREMENKVCSRNTTTLIVAGTTIAYADGSDTFRTMGPRDPDSYLLWFQEDMPRLRPDTWQDFVEMNQVSYSVPSDLAFYRDTYVEGDVPSRKQSACGKLWFSRVGFNHDGTQALLYYEYLCGTMCWGSLMMLFEQTPTGWQQVDEIRIGMT